MKSLDDEAFNPLSRAAYMLELALCRCVNASCCQSYLSMMAHRSRLTFSNAPVVPFSTAWRSAGWSSTKIACMQPWKERREGGNGVWRK